MGVTGNSADHCAVSGEEVHEARSGDMQRIVHGRVLQGVRHHHHGGVVDIGGLNTERRISGGTRACRDRWRGPTIVYTPRRDLALLLSAVGNPTIGGTAIWVANR